MTVFRTITIFLLATLGFAHGQITDPIPRNPTNSNVGVVLEQWVKIPDSDGKPARLINFKPIPDGSGRFLVLDQRGYLWMVRADGSHNLYLDLRQQLGVYNPESLPEMGAYSVALHPDFEDNGVFFTASSTEVEGSPDFFSPRPIINNEGIEVSVHHHDIVMKWEASNPSSNTFSGSGKELLRFEQPFRSHNVGEMGFKPVGRDNNEYGLLYISVPDGGSDGFPATNTDPLDVGQDLTTPLGSIIRIDPLGSNSPNGRYGIPSLNPFSDDEGKVGEIYAFGFRNPHRFCWDPDNIGDFYVFEIGQNFIEEINYVKPGRNYGWGEREGKWILEDTNEFFLYEPANDGGMRDPVLMYDHPDSPGANSGGYVYRGDRIPRLRGHFVFGDFTWGGRLMHAPVQPSGQEVPADQIYYLRVFNEAEIETTAAELIGGSPDSRTDIRWGQDLEGELYLTSKQSGWVYRVWAPSFQQDNSNGGGQTGNATQAEVAARIPGAVSAGGARYETNWFTGFFVGEAGWVFHDQHGWIYPGGVVGSGTVYWENALGWLYTDPGTYPWLYRFDERSWLWFDQSSKSPRWFYSWNAAGWRRVD